MKIGLYSISYLGIWYAGPALSFEQFVKQAKACGYAGIELDGKRPHGNPMDLDQRARERMRTILEREGMEIPCVAAYRHTRTLVVSSPAMMRGGWCCGISTWASRSLTMPTLSP